MMVISGFGGGYRSSTGIDIVVIEATSDPAGDSWTPVATLTMATDEETWVDPVSEFVPFRFYRARFVP